MRWLLALWLTIAPACAQEAVIGSGVYGGNKASGFTTGPGDIVSGATLAVSVRSYNLAYATGSNKSANLRRASDNAQQDINIKTNGNFDQGSADTFCAATSCFITKGYDESGNSNDCSEATAANQPGYVNNNSPFSGYNVSFSFGTGLQLQCAQISPTGNFTYIAWIYPTSFTGTNVIFGSVNNGGAEFRINTSKQLDLVVQNIVDVGHSTGTLSANTWACVAVTYNPVSGAFIFYIGGSSSGSGTNAQSPSSQNLMLGFAASSSEHFTGDIAEWLFYSSILTGTQINNICNSTSP